MARPKNSLIDDVAAYLGTRRDIQVLARGEGRIVGVHLRRVLEHKVWGASVFSPHERDLWFYYGQAFVIEEARFDDEGKLVEDLEEMSAALTKVGTKVILPQTLSYVINELGAEPQDLADYFARREK